MTSDVFTVTESDGSTWVSIEDYNEVKKERDEYSRILHFLYDDGPVFEGFADMEKDCYNYAFDLMKDDGEIDDDDPRWFQGWINMIKDEMKKRESEK
jgi:hypothetical protein